MKLIQAIAKSAPRLVNTKYGQRTVIDAIGNDGQEITIWRGGDDCSPALSSITNGSRIAVGMDSKGKYSLIEAPGDRAEASQREISPVVEMPRPMGFTVNLPMEAERQLQRQVQTRERVTAGNAVKAGLASSINTMNALLLASQFEKCLGLARRMDILECDHVRVALALFDRLPQN